MKTLCNYLILFIITSALAMTACGGGGSKADSRVNGYNVNLEDLGVSDGTLVLTLIKQDTTLRFMIL